MLSGCLFQHRSDYFQQAEARLKDNDYSGAITLMHKHIEERLAYEERPDWENPYFHLLMIGDIQLKSGAPEQALTTYEQAEALGVEKGLISDRFRYVASWYEKQGNLRDSIRVLEKYRERDPLLFDMMLDRISKTLTLNEEAQSATAILPANTPKNRVSP